VRTFKLWLLDILESLARRKLDSGAFKDEREREAARRILATVRAFRGSMELE